MALVPVGAGGAITLYNNAGTTDLVVDVLGWAPTGDLVRPVAPARLMDTRKGATTADGVAQATGALTQGSTTSLLVAGRAGVPAGVAAVVVNLTGTEGSSDTYLTAFASGGERPTASNLNVARGRTVANVALVPVGSDGRIVIYNNAGAQHLVADLLGYVLSGPGLVGLTPARVLDTRTGAGAVGAGETVTLQMLGAGGVPGDGVAAVVLNITVTEPTVDTYVTASAGGTPRPLASNVNAPRGATVANLAIVPLGADGTIALYNNAGATHLVVDVLGWFAKV
jgi:hypothetical protein